SDEAVIATIRNECERLSIRRPRRIFARAARVEGLLGLFRTVDRCEPDAAVARKRDSVAVGSDDWIVSIRDKFRGSSRSRYRPDLNPRLNRALCGIGRTITLAARSVVTAAHVHNRFAVARK